MCKNNSIKNPIIYIPYAVCMLYVLFSLGCEVDCALHLVQVTVVCDSVPSWESQCLHMESCKHMQTGKTYTLLLSLCYSTGLSQ